jgi:Putative zinc-finger
MSVYMPLDCDGFAAALADYLEGDAPDAVRAAVEAHAEDCAECSLLLADLHAIPRRAAALPALTPSRDLWSGIAERIDARVLPMQRPATQIIVPARRSWARPAIAAAALVIVTAGITHYATRARYATSAAVASAPVVQKEARESVTEAAPQMAIITPSTPPSGENTPPSTLGQPNAQRTDRAPQVAASTRPGSGRAAPSGTRLVGADSVMNETEPLYDREITKLRTIVTSRRSTLDPATITVLEQSIAVIDSAIAQSRSALAKDPASGFLANQLNHSLEKKVELLRTAAMLPART